jgi:hypothetical protein
MRDGSLVGVLIYVELFAFLCAIFGITFFGGTQRESLLDRDNLLGLLLIGLAAMVHGGFVSVLRSSPEAQFSGYILGSEGLPDDAWIYLYDLGYPPEEFESGRSAWYEPPVRMLHIVSSKSNAPPESFLHSDVRYQLTCVYRSWDLRVTSIHAVPVPARRHRLRPGMNDKSRGQHVS